MLPGIEDSSSEYYKKSFSLLLQIEQNAGTLCFYKSIWLNAQEVSYTRIPILKFIRETAVDQQTAESVSLTYNEDARSAVVAMLCDERTLVQRDTMDVVLKYFKLEKISTSLDNAEAIKMFKAILLLLTKKEIALIRRVIQFLLGRTENEPSNAEAEKCYFEAYGKELLVQTLNEIMVDTIKKARKCESLFTIVFQLLENEAIASSIINDVITIVLRTTLRGKEDKASNDDILKQVNEFIFRVDNEAFWNGVSLCYTSKLNDVRQEGQYEPISLIDTLLDVIIFESVEEKNEVTILFLPELLNTVLKSMKSFYAAGNFAELNRSLKLSLKIIGKIPQIDYFMQAKDKDIYASQKRSILSSFTDTGTMLATLSGLFTECEASNTEHQIKQPACENSGIPIASEGTKNESQMQNQECSDQSLKNKCQCTISAETDNTRHLNNSEQHTADNNEEQITQNCDELQENRAFSNEKCNDVLDSTSNENMNNQEIIASEEIIKDENKKEDLTQETEKENVEKYSNDPEQEVGVLDEGKQVIDEEKSEMVFEKISASVAIKTDSSATRK